MENSAIWCNAIWYDQVWFNFSSFKLTSFSMLNPDHTRRLSSIQYLTAYCLCFSHLLSIFISVFSSLLYCSGYFSCGDKRGDERSCFLCFLSPGSYNNDKLSLARAAGARQGPRKWNLDDSLHWEILRILILKTFLDFTQSLGLCHACVFSMIMSWLLKVIEVSRRDGQQAPPCEMSRPRVLGVWTSLRFGATHRFSPPERCMGSVSWLLSCTLHCSPSFHDYASRGIIHLTCICLTVSHFAFLNAAGSFFSRLWILGSCTVQQHFVFGGRTAAPGPGSLVAQLWS